MKIFDKICAWDYIEFHSATFNFKKVYVRYRIDCDFKRFKQKSFILIQIRFLSSFNWLQPGLSTSHKRGWNYLKSMYSIDNKFIKFTETDLTFYSRVAYVIW